jgi:quercetin dioxygenase-like cupin family protein
VEKRRTGPYALRAREGWVYDVGAELTVKLGERGQGRRFAVLEYTTDQDEWPGHTHPTEDEVFYVLEGALTFRCGEDTFDVDEGGFVFLPSRIEHGYKIRGAGEAHLLVVTAPAPGAEATPGWEGFVGGLEASAELQASPSPARGAGVDQGSIR